MFHVKHLFVHPVPSAEKPSVPVIARPVRTLVAAIRLPRPRIFVGTNLARPVRRRRTIAPRAIHGTRSVVGICLRQIAFVPNAGRLTLRVYP